MADGTQHRAGVTRVGSVPRVPGHSVAPFRRPAAENPSLFPFSLPFLLLGGGFALAALAGPPWVVANDEQGGAQTGVPPDPGYAGYAGHTRSGKPVGYDLHDIRKFTLWGNLMAGGAGVEYYFGYGLPQNDLVGEDWRSRDRSWDFGRIALDFLRQQQIPFWQMRNANALVGNPAHDDRRFCLALPGELYLVYLPAGGAVSLDLTEAARPFRVAWFNPRAGGPLQTGSVERVQGGRVVDLGFPPADREEDWVAVVRP